MAPPSIRPSAAKSTQGDFEIEAAEVAAEHELAVAPTMREPDFLELRADNDSDVAFPVIEEAPPGPTAAPPTKHASDADLPGGWLWAEEVDDDEEDEDADSDAHLAAAAPAIASGGKSVAGGLEILDDSLDLDLDVPGRQYQDVNVMSRTSRVALPVVKSRDWEDLGAEGEDEEGDFTLSRSGPATVEELDLAPMVDVAFQLVLFFMVTATTVLYRTLEIPKPSNEQAPSSVAQGRSLEEMQDDFILVEIDPSGSIKVDREPVAADLDSLIERLRTSREKTHRKSMLLSADYTTKHRSCVLVYDAALDIGLGISIASPQAPQGPAPSLLPGARPSVQPTPAKAAAPPAAPTSGPPI